MDALHPADRLESLNREECLGLLGTDGIGRLGFVADGRPRIEPVNYAMLGGAVIVLSRPGAKLEAAAHEQTVVFEVDSVEEWARAGWSVLVVGPATVISNPTELADAASHAPQAWAQVADSRFIRIDPQEITGRRVRVDRGRVTVLRQGADQP